jgi:ubiquitin-protein ligase
MYLDMESSYPASPPTARFITPILHPNVTKQGRICHSILDSSLFQMLVLTLGNWTRDTSCVDVINSIWALLLVPDLQDPAYRTIFRNLS